MGGKLTVCAILLVFPGIYAQSSDRNNDGLEEKVEEMARVGSAYSPSFSPDGSRIAFVADPTGIPQVWVIPSRGGYPELVTNGNDPVTAVRWSPEEESALGFVVAPGGGMNTQIYVVRPDGTDVRRVTAGGKESNTFAGWTHDGKRLMMGSNQRDASAVDPYLTDPLSGKLDRLQAVRGFNSVEDVSRDGRFALISRVVSRSSNDLYLLNLDTRREILLTRHDGPGRFTGQFAADGRTVYLLSNRDSDLAAFGRLAITAEGVAGPIELIAARGDAELDMFLLNEQGTLAVLVWNVGGRNELGFVRLPAGTMVRGPGLPAELVTGLAFSRDGRQLALTLTGSRAPSDLWVLNVDSNNLRQLTFSAHAGVKLADLVQPEFVTFSAQDGLPLSGWLYRPKPLGNHAPYVLSFHGGPEAEERPGFRSEYQALLTQGIGVFAPNVRGSAGFGKRFENLDNGALRANAVKDIKTCVDFLIAKELADRARVGIAGGSYGGYMTMAGVTEYPDLFAAAVDLYGVVNFETFFAHTEPWMAAVSKVKYGDPVFDEATLRALSPIHKLDRIKAAIMVQHGANDTNVPVVEAEQIVRSLRERGVPVEYLLFADEGHGFRKQANRTKSTLGMVEFFAKHLAADVPKEGK